MVSNLARDRKGLKRYIHCRFSEAYIIARPLQRPNGYIESVYGPYRKLSTARSTDDVISGL